MRPLHERCIILLAVLAAAAPVAAKVSGPCVDCHTMHNSQGGGPMAFVMQGGGKVLVVDPNAALLTTDCVGCHQGINDGTTTPFVFSTTAPTYGTTGTEGGTNTLAGGNFYWVSSGNERAGHNVSGITAVDSRHATIPPGGVDLGAQITCAGTYGCHGVSGEADQTKAMYGAHHWKNHAVWQDGLTLASSYRFLDGIKGFEDPDYEYQPTSTSHNKYYGIDRTLETDTADGTISSLCARCHGDFHNGSGNLASGSFGSGVWIRHPVDFDMSRAVSSGEYLSYNKQQGTGNPYSVIAPLATADTTTAVQSSVFVQADDAVVMCLSCHRAHGTPFAAILRWDYRSWPGGGYNGCSICHTTKD